MKKYEVIQTKSGHSFGIYEARCDAEAIFAMLCDADGKEKAIEAMTDGSTEGIKAIEVEA
jgi:hypothetical protein